MKIEKSLVAGYKKRSFRLFQPYNKKSQKAGENISLSTTGIN